MFTTERSNSLFYEGGDKQLIIRLSRTIIQERKDLRNTDIFFVSNEIVNCWVDSFRATKAMPGRPPLSPCKMNLNVIQLSDII